MLAAEFCDDVLTAVDCACGTGALTVRLAEKGIAVTGVDISEEMLRIAGENAASQDLQIPFVRQDMAHLSVHKSVEPFFARATASIISRANRRAHSFLRQPFGAPAGWRILF